MKKVVRLTESDLVRLVKRVISEQVENPFYTFLKEKKYKMYNFDQWSKLPEYGEIKGSLKPFNYNGGDTLYFKNVDDSPLPYRLITDGKKVYFLNPGIPKTIKDYVDSFKNPSKSYNGPFTVFEIKKEQLKKGNLKKIQKEAWETFKNSDGVFVVLKTDKDKEIAVRAERTHAHRFAFQQYCLLVSN